LVEFDCLGKRCCDLGAASVVERRKVPSRASESFMIMIYSYPEK
jgi:hypothetical protein